MIEGTFIMMLTPYEGQGDENLALISERNAGSYCISQFQTGF